MTQPIPGWPWWQRVNMFAFTVGGGFIGFYFQGKYALKHKEKLMQEIPALDEKLAELIAQREQLERALREAELDKSD